MYIIIVGDSYLSLEIAKRCIDKDHKIIMVVENKSNISEFNDLSQIIFVEGKANSLATFEELDMKKCDIFIACTDKDDKNLIAAVYAKESGAKKVFVKTNNNSTASIIEKIGLLPFIPDKYFAQYFGLSVKQEAVALLSANILGNKGSPQISIVEKKITPNSSLLGRRINEIKGEFFSAIAFFKDGIFFINPEGEIFENSTLLIIVDNEKIDSLDKELKAFKK